MYRSIVVAYQLHSEYIDKTEVWADVYKTLNAIHNYIVSNLSGYVLSLDANDFAQIMNDEEFLQIRKLVTPHHESVENANREAVKWLMTTDKYQDNKLMLCVRAKVVPVMQLLQTLLCRGFVTETDSSIYPIPVTEPFGGGFKKLYSHTLELRSAAKAILFQKDPLRDSEYTNRKNQLVSDIIHTVDKQKCEPHPFDYTVSSEKELSYMEGTYYRTPKGEWVALRKTDKELIGKTIQIRTAFGCNSPIKQGVCWACIGEISHSYPEGANPGHIAATQYGEPVSQLTMSVKHHDGSSKVDAVSIESEYETYLRPGELFQGISLSPEMVKHKAKIHIANDDHRGLEALSLSDITKVALTDISFIADVFVTIDNIKYKVPVGAGSRKAHLTRTALMYIVANGYELGDKNDLVIDVGNWDLKKSFFQLPFKHTSMSDYKQEIERFHLTSKANDKTGLRSYNDRKKGADVMLAVKDFAHLMNERMYVNFSHVQILAYAMAAEIGRSDLLPPKGGAPCNFIQISQRNSSGSLGVAYSYENQGSHSRNINTYTNVPAAHPLDVLFQ